MKGRLLRGTGAQTFSQAVHFFIRLAEVPLLLAFWGTQLYGEWLMLAAIPAYLAIGDGGFTTAACRDMTMKSGAGDREGAHAVFQSIWLLLLAVSLVVFLLAYGFAEWAPLHKWLGFSTMTAADTRAVLLLLVAHVLIGFQGGLLNGGFWVAGRYPAGMFLSAITRLLEFFGLGLAVVLGGGPVQAAEGYLGGRIVGTCVMWIGQRAISPWLRHGFSRASVSELKRLTVPAFASLAFPLGNALNIQGMRLIVGIVLGPRAVAIFTPLRTLSRFAMQPRAVINRLIQPEMALAYGANDGPLFQRLFLRSCQFSFWGSLLTTLVVGVSAYWFFPVWTSGQVGMQWSAFSLLLVGVLANSVWNTALMVPYATNRHGRMAVCYSLVYGAGAFILGYYGAEGLDLSGVALALLIVEGVMAAIVIRTALSMTHGTIGQWVASVVRPPIAQVRALLRGNASATPN